MKCEEIQDQLLLSGHAREMEGHLRDCGECREFSKIVAGMHGDVKQTGPSAELDARVLDFARSNRPAKKQPVPFYFLTAVAALLVICFSIMILAQKQNKDLSDKSLAGRKELNVPKVEAPVAEQNTLQAQKDLDEALETLWDDDVMTADMTTIEGELFVLSAELYSN